MQIKYWLGIAGTLVSFFTSNIWANTAPSPFNYFVGVDFQDRTMTFENDFGHGLFREHAFQYDLYGGIRFWNCWGLEIGYYANKSKNRVIEFGPGDIALGQTLTLNDPTETHYTETKIKGPHIDVLGYYSLIPSWGIEMLGGVGVAYSKLMLKDAIIEENNISMTSPISRTYDIKKANARALVGLQTLVYACVGIRATVTWENTNVFNDLKPTEFPNDVRRVNLENSWLYGLGIFAII